MSPEPKVSKLSKLSCIETINIFFSYWLEWIRMVAFIILIFTLPAVCKGVLPLLLFVFQISGFKEKKKSTSSAFVSLQARWKGVQPSLLTRSHEAFLVINFLITDECPFAEASISGVQSALFRGSISAPVTDKVTINNFC